MKKIKFLYIIILSIFIVSCSDDFIDTAPGGASLSSDQVASSPSAAKAALFGIYASLRSRANIGGEVDYGQKGYMAMMDLLGQDVVLNNFNWYIFIYNYNGRQQTSSRTNNIWTTYYRAIADANSIILSLPETGRSAEQDAILGQALAIKSLSFFNLVRVYAHTYIGHENDPGVPIPDRTLLDARPRGTVQDVYDQIIPDLEKAVTLLDGYTRSSKQEINKSVAQAILANVYLETGNWQGAADNAAAARSSYSLMAGADYATDGFDNIGNVEWMWGADIDAQTTTTFASFFSHFDSSLGGYGGIGFGAGYKMIEARLYDMIPDTDLRKAAWVSPTSTTSPYPAYTNTKFMDASGSFAGDYSYLRASEMYLVEAEAKARLGDATATDILFDLVSNRDPGYVRSTNTGDALVEEIYLQRRIELWGEGVAWLDLKRLKKPLDRTGAGTNHRSFGAVDIPVEGDFFRFQIPQDELNSNSMINDSDQNP